jgi:hypothetical protein
VEEAKATSYVSYLLWEWVTTCINTRKAALVVRSERLGVPLINDPVNHDGSGEDEEEDLEEGLHLSCSLHFSLFFTRFINFSFF